MRQATLEKLCTLVGGFFVAHGGQCENISGTHWTDEMGRRDRTPGYSVGDVTIIKLPRDVPSQAPRASIPYFWIFEGAPKEEVGF